MSARKAYGAPCRLHLKQGDTARFEKTSTRGTNSVNPSRRATAIAHRTHEQRRIARRRALDAEPLQRRPQSPTPNYDLSGAKKRKWTTAPDWLTGVWRWPPSAGGRWRGGDAEPVGVRRSRSSAPRKRNGSGWKRRRGIEGVRNQQREIVGTERGRIPLPEFFYSICLLVLPPHGHGLYLVQNGLGPTS